MDKDELLRLIDEDPDVRAKVQALLPAAKAAKEAEAPEPEPVFNGPDWLKDKAKAHGPHSAKRFEGPKA